MIENWKAIPGYEGLYEASTLGRIRTAEGKTTSSRRFFKRVWKQRILKGRGSNPRIGYRVSLWKDGKEKDWLVARLVAMTWIDGYREGMTVNHKDRNRFNNNVDNLEWLSQSDNIRHAFDTGMPTQKPVSLIHIESGQIHSFDSMSSASRFLGKNPKYISNMLHKGYKELCGYRIQTGVNQDNNTQSRVAV